MSGWRTAEKKGKHGELRSEKSADGYAEKKRRKKRRKRGIKEGEKRLSQLILTLGAEGRTADILRVAEDASLRNRLYRKYGL